MTDAVNTWEELTLNGTATSTGCVELTFSGYNEHDATVTGADNYYSPKTLGWQKIYADGISVEYT